MNAPTLTLGASVVTLPYPDASAKNERSLAEVKVQRRTIGGALRTTFLSWAYGYSLGFTQAPLATYDAIVALWQAAIASGTYPTFTWDLFPSASAVAVAVDLGPAAPSEAGLSLVDFALSLSEVNPR
jgi:hypothetical protein